MSKKLILFLMVLLFGSTSFLRADEVQIGEGTASNSYLPSYSLYNYSFTQQIYTADEIGVGAGTINSIAFYNSGTEKVRDYDMYFVNTTKTAFDGTTDWITVTAADKVFTGSVVMAAGEWTTLTLTTPFAYDGTNLAVIVDDNSGNWSSGMSCYVFDAANQALRIYSDPTNYDPTNPSSYTGTLMSVKNQIVINITTSGPTPPPTPPTPTGEFSITPNDAFALGQRPKNGWMEPFTVRLFNGGATATVSASMSNTSGVEPFIMSQEIDNYVLATDEALEFEVEWNADAADGEYAEEFTLFYAENRDIITIPVTAELYTAGEADIVETAKNLTLSYSGGVASFSHTPSNLHANYYGYNQSLELDAVYSFKLNKDSKINVDGGTFIGIYKKVSHFHPTPAIEPVASTYTGSLTDQVLLAGQYYMIVAGDNISTVSGTVQQLPAPTELTYIAPEDQLTGVEGNVALTWEGGENATQYQVLFGTSPTSMPVVLDWTTVDANYGTFDVTNLIENNTQYFWQIKVKNSNGTVTGPRWGFTTALTTPNTVTATEQQIFTDGSTLIKWKHNAGGGGFVGELTVADGTTTNSYLPVYGLWADYYTRGEMIYPAEMLEEMEGGEITSLTFYLSSPASATWAPDVFQVYFQEVDATTMTTYYTAANAQICYTGALDGTGTTMTINLDEPYTYQGGNLLLGIQETVNGVYKSASFYGIAATGASASGYNSSSLAGVTFNQRNFLPKVTFTCGGRTVAQNRTFQGFNLYYMTNENAEPIKVNDELILEKQYLLDGVLPYNMEPGNAVAVTAVYSEGESALSAPVMVQVSGYGTLNGTVTELISGQPIADVNVKFVGKDEFDNNATFEGTTNANGAYTINNVKAGNYTGTARLEGMEPATATVTLAYEATETVNFIMHEVYNPVMSVVAEEMDSELARVRWSMTEVLPVPNPGGNTPGGGGSASSFTEGFEGGMPAGWSVIDGNNDGWTWCLTSAIPSTWTYYASMSLDWYRTGSNAICSGSYINGVGALTPNEFLVMGQQTIANGSTLSFWAAACDASYAADHFGVAVSDNGTDWTMVQEWTLTGKSGNDGGRASRDGNGAKLGTWHNFTADLSAFAGQKYIALRHFNCNDQYIMCVDDIELSTAKGNRAVQQYALYRVPILTEGNEFINVEELEDVDPYYVTTTFAPDTLYADFDWANMEPGLYQYGVSAIYPGLRGGNRDEVIIGEGATTNSYIPTYNLYNYSCTNQIYTVEEIGGAGTINSIAFMPVTVNTPSRNLNVYMVNTDKTSFTGGTDWIPVTDADLVYSGSVAWTANTWCTIELTNPFAYDGTNLCVVVNDLTGSWTSSNSYKADDATAQAIRIYQDSAPYNPAAPGNGTVLNVKNQIKLDIDFGGGGGNDNPVTDVVWSNVLPKDMTTTVVLKALVPDQSAEGVIVRFNNTIENSTFAVTLDETGIDTIADFRKGEYTVTFEFEGYTSNIENAPYSIWEDTELVGTFEEIYKPVDNVTVTRMGYASWDQVVIPVNDRIAERYLVTLNGAQYAEITDNFLQINEEDLTVGETYTVGVAVIYSTGMSPYTYGSFTYTDCNGATYQVTDLTAANVAGNTNVTLAWDGENPNPNPGPNPPQGGDVIVKLTAGDVWGDGTGYQMLLDDTHSLYGTTIPTSGALSLSCSGNDGIYNQFSHKIPTNADGNCSTSNIVISNTVEITIPAGTYDWCIVNPTPGDRLWIAASNGNVGGRQDDYVFEGGHTYEFTVSMFGSNDGVNVTITGGKAMYQPSMGQMSTDVRTNNYVASSNVMNAGEGFGAAETPMTRDWYYYDNGVNEDAIGTGGGNFWWGIMLPAGQYDGNRLTKVAAYDYMAMTGTASIYQGGTSAPAGSALGSVNVSFTGSSDFVEFEFAEAVELDPDQNVWVIFYNASGATYPAAVCANTGDANGRWVSLDGAAWADLASYGLDNTFMVRAFIESGSGPAPSALVPNKYNIFFDGELVGATANKTFTYDATDFEEHEYMVIWVDSDYLTSCVVEGENVINYAATTDGIAENGIISAIYPNPTSSDLHINATAMKHISVYNAMGQMVYDQDVDANEIVLNMGQYEAGVYMVSVITENGTSVKRVTVTK